MLMARLFLIAPCISGSRVVRPRCAIYRYAATAVTLLRDRLLERLRSVHKYYVRDRRQRRSDRFVFHDRTAQIE